jgi:hypothetical protein
MDFDYCVMITNIDPIWQPRLSTNNSNKKYLIEVKYFFILNQLIILF